ncbi:hypothetical protein BH11PSE3_BH11PSE3_14850 [soil metagenome]
MPRIHPFVYGHVAAAGIVGVAAGASLGAAQAAGVGAALLTAGAIVSSLICAWWPGFEAPAWRLIPVAILGNPVMLAALCFIGLDWDCAVSSRGGLNCLVASLAILVAGACLLPPFGGWSWRWWKGRSPR